MATATVPLAKAPVEPAIWLRRDLEIVPREDGSETVWIVGDPVRLEYFQFREVEVLVLEALQRPLTASGLWQTLRNQLPHSMTPGDLKLLLNRLIADNLLVVQGWERGRQLFGAGERAARGRLVATAGSLLSVKLWSFSPRLLLRGLHPWGVLLFHRMTLAGAAICLALSLCFALLSIATLAGKVPTLESLLSPEHLALMVLAFGLVKTLHELGHGLAAAACDSECEEMGILLLVGFPCLYCDVSDVWLNPRRFPRILVSAAGIYVELLIALVAFWVWYLSLPGPINSFCFSLLLITSVNTLLINGNPLLRYDGYFVVSDLTNSPNLGKDAEQTIEDLLERIFYCDRGNVAGISPWKFSYGVAAAAYRLSISIAIVSGLYLAGKAYGLQWLAMLAALALACLLLIPAGRAIAKIPRLILRPGKKLGSWLAWGLVCIGLVGLSCYLPIPQHVHGAATVYFRDPQLVFAPRDGRLQPLVSQGDFVTAGDLMFQLLDPASEEVVIAQVGEFELNKNQLDALQARLALGQPVERELELARERLELSQLDLAAREAEASQLAIRAARGGRVVGVPFELGKTDADAGAGNGGWLDPKNHGKGIKRGQLICLVSDPEQFVGIVPIAENAVNELKIGQPVEVYSSYSDKPLTGLIERISQAHIDSGRIEPEQLDGPSSTAQDGLRRYLVEFSLQSAHPFRHGTTTRVAIPRPPQTLWQLLYQFVGRESFL